MKSEVDSVVATSTRSGDVEVVSVGMLDDMGWSS